MSHEPTDQAQSQPLTLEWTPVGPANGGSAVPPNAAQIADYALVWDPKREAVVYVISPDYHQFGHAWARTDGSWTQLSHASVRLGDAAQLWQAFYDVGRSAVVGWCFDDEAPVGVLLTDHGLRLLASDAGANKYCDEVPVNVLSGDAPVGEPDDWDDLRGVFGYDRGARLTVCVTESAVHTLDTAGAWRKVGDVEIEGSVGGDRAFGGGVGSFWDTPRARLVFWFWDSDDDVLRTYAFNGEGLTPLSSDGLPDDLHTFGGGGFTLGQSEKHGAVLYAGPELGAFKPEDDGWKSAPHGRDGPPRHKAANLVVTPKNQLILGPGTYPPDGDQNVFYVRQAAGWKMDGAARRKSLLDAVRGSGGHNVVAFAEGTAYAVHWRDDLHTIAWSAEAGWRVIVHEAQALHDAHSSTHRGAILAGPGGALHAIFNDGAVFRLTGDEWTVVRGRDDAFGDRFGFAAGFDGEHFMVFGGQIKNRASDHTLRLTDNSWVKLPSSPRPADLDADFHLVFDGGLGRMVRFGAEVAVLDDDDVWSTVEVPGYSGEYGVMPLALGGGVILLSLERFFRFDLAGVALLALSQPPAHVVLRRQNKPHDNNRFPYWPDCAFDPTGPTLLTSHRDDAGDNWAVDLTPAFAAAAALGDRTPWVPPAPEVWRYRDDAVWFATGNGPIQIQVNGAPAGQAATLEAALAAAEAEGWVTPEKIDPAIWRARFGRPASKLELAYGPPGKSHLGGLPNGIDWPEGEDGPLGMLFQVELPEGLVPGAAAVAVFVPLDGTATEEAELNVAVLLTAAQLAAEPTPAPEGIPVLPRARFGIGAPEVERDDAALAKAPDDAALATVIEGLDLPTPGTSKLGGLPNWVQGPETDEPLILQLDFDHIHFDAEDKEAWPDAGLCGVIYVFATEDGPTVLWQYT